ncbi:MULTISPECIES: GNAT family N-acetyltransferase [unclassified Massilia]|uniref:GNAT family N-acetyltransferase n=1 Tax=unclassified Massilia TaxID=2609279 RepID=UPI0017856E87|nr:MULTISPECIES: GNAT family N-acetyltransferase [unclassified Massilia]MBD8532431.1 GNAT family N-acetyltransferase [Massilia sp. CFBP 13647]MBD8675743.1 GNAT family N-acetyltransferase [Massilia sp. CFBP 13721]
MIVLQTERLRLRHMTPGDAAFMLGLLNDPAWHRFIGDRGIRTVEGAREYILNGPMAMVARHGFGFHVVELKEGGCPLGVCGLAKRDFLDDVDIGYAFLPQYGGQGYALEAAQGVLAHARALGLKRLVATVVPENAASIRLLEKLGLRFERSFQAPDSTRALQLFALALA